MELRAAYPALARRFPRLELAVDASELVFHERSIVYGVESLPVYLDSRGASTGLIARGGLGAG